MNVLSLFDGMSCGRIALEKAGFKVDNYFASEIDKYAMKVSAANYPDIVQLGDVTQVKGSDLPQIDLLIGGSPCQGFSLAGKQLNFSDPRSALFFEFVRLKNECNPKWWMLENVKMKKEYQYIISEYMGCNPIEINSALVSAQNRVRLYWTNIPVVGLPEDRCMLLKDVLESEVDEKYFLSDKMADWLNNHSNKKQSEGCGFKLSVKEPDEKGNAVNQRCYKMGVDDNYIKVLGNLYENNPQGGRVYSPEGKSSCLNGEAGGAGGKTGLYAVKTKIRRLTPREALRLQTVPEKIIDVILGIVSDTQIYRMAGNGWTCEKIAWIFEFMREDRVKQARETRSQTDLFDMMEG